MLFRHPACRVLEECLEMLAPKHTSTKFVKIVSTECIPGYPDSNLPTLIVYRNTDVAHQFIGMQHFNGMRATPIGMTPSRPPLDPLWIPSGPPLDP
eukprot:3546327-Pyramimonas_sp.AAC.2